MGPISFAKMAADLDANPKVRRAGRNGREVYLFILRRVALLRAQGKVPVSNVDPWYLADQLMMSEDEAQQGLDACLRRERDGSPGLLVIEGGMCIVAGWDDEWGRQPMTEAERKAKQRARGGDGGNGNGGEPSGESRGVRTRPDSHGSDQIRSEEKREEDPDRVGAAEIAIGSAACAAPRPTPTEFDPSDWSPEPSDANTYAALEAARLGVIVEQQLVRFRIHAKRKRWNRQRCSDEWPGWLAIANPAPEILRNELTRVRRERDAKAARERERLELAETARRAEADREDCRRAVQEFLVTNPRLNAKEATG